MKVSLFLFRRALAGGEAAKYFDTLRAQIASDLAANSNDKSIAGRVDPLIQPLVSFINDNFQQYVTSSSCSGRISLFHKGKTDIDSTDAAVGKLQERKRGAFGRGTLFQSHDPLPDVQGTVETQLIPALKEFTQWRASQPTTPRILATELLQLKYEPMILHILCRDIESAAALLQCASEGAQTNSGIVSCSRGTPESRKITCSITSPVMVDIPLMSHGSWAFDSTDFDDKAWQHFLYHTVSHINALFSENMVRMERFQSVMNARLLKQDE